MNATGAISRMEVRIVSVPVISKRSHGIGDVGGNMKNVVLRLETDQGLIGWGEASPWPVFLGTAEASAAALDVYLRPLVMGAEASRVSDIMARTDTTITGHSDAKAALEMALFDILGKAAGLPVAELLGGRCRDRVPLSVSLANPDFDADKDLAHRLYEDGVRIVKLKTGFAGHEFDIRRLEWLRGEMPDDLALRVDYNQGMTPWEALGKLRDIETFEPEFIEQPVPAGAWQAMADLTAALDTPVLADETVFTPADALSAVAGRWADGFSVKVMKSGGMRRGQEIAAIGAAAGMPCYGGDMFETGLAHLAGLHMVAASPNISLGCEYYQARYYVSEDILAAPFPIENGAAMVPTTPGLGFDVDETRLADVTVETRG